MDTLISRVTTSVKNGLYKVSISFTTPSLDDVRRLEDFKTAEAPVSIKIDRRQE